MRHGGFPCFGTMHLFTKSFMTSVMITTAVMGTAGTLDGQAAAQVAAALPRSVDLRPEFETFGLTPRVQGDRGTCSGFTITQAIEFAYAMRLGHGPDRLSVEFLNWASNVVNGDSEDGGFFSDLWSGFASFGISTEEAMPYNASYDPDAQPSEAALADAKLPRDAELRLNWIKYWDPNRGLNEAQLRGVKEALAAGWPVGGGFLWPTDASWSDGLLEIVPREQVFDGHSILLVGYRDDVNLPGGGAFIIRNSGGPSRDGLVTYEYALAYMNDAVWIDFAEPGERAQTAPALPDYLSLLAPPPAGRNRRVSSNQQPNWNDANMDMTMMAPGDVIEVPLLEGPGMITHIWMTSHAGWVSELNSLTLRMWWDDREEPGIEVPLGMFFAQGPGMPSSVQSFPVQVSPSGSLSCYWRMPFAESARITITNDNPDRTAGLYWQIDWLELDSLPADTPYLHARYRREYPTRPGDYELADLEGTGHYVGTVMAMTMGQDGWYGEGDDFFRIDGEAVPSHQGTGSEDYFNDAWGGRVRTTLWFGQPSWQGYGAGDTGTAYRWHLLDPVGFSNSLFVSIEHKGNRATSEDAWYIERPDFYSSVAFWYQRDVPKAWEPIPSWYERRVPWQTNHLVRAFRNTTVTGETVPEVTTQGFFGARPVLVWPTTEPDETMTIPFSVEGDGRYAVRLVAMGIPGQGLFDIAIDGEVVLANVDFQTSETAELDILLGTLEMADGGHRLELTSRVSAARAAAPVGVELLRLLRLPPEAVREPKLHFEAHFIRLGIGRAVYAYRLAYDRLPESLQELVESGIMPERYLSDENLVPLVSRLEGENFVVVSTGPGLWTHRWQGLDARR